MVSSRLEILGQDYPIVIDIPISITFQQADVREPDKRNASQSKTIRLYGTNSTNLLFENLFDVNIATQTFNPNKKSQCIYFVDEIPQFRGDLQLTKITIEPDNNVVYDCNIVGNEGNVFIDIGEKLLSDLDFSAYDHTYSRSNIINSWDNYVAGTGYYYPFVDNGRNGGSFNNFIVEQFIPTFSAKEYIDKILTDAGYSYSSAFLNGAEFKRNIIYPNINKIALSDLQLERRQFFVGLSSNVTLPNNVSTVVNLNNESAPFYDSSPAQYNAGFAIINENGSYNLNATDYFKVTVSHTDPSVTRVAFSELNTWTEIRKSGDGGIGWFFVCQDFAPVLDNQFGYLNTQASFPVGNYFIARTSSASNYPLSSGDYIEHRARIKYNNPRYFTSSNVEVTTGTGTITLELESGTNKTSFALLSSSSELVAGNTVEANLCLPTTIKQKDFFKWIMQMYNLFIDVDKTNPKALVIEPYYTYFNLGVSGSSIVNWENKIDRDKPFEVNPLFLLEGRNYEYTYKEDKDFYNQKYIKNKGEIFGYHKVTIDNDFLSQTKKNEIGFSPTPNVENVVIGAIYPRIYDVDDSGIKTIANNIRILYANPTTSINNYNFNDSQVGNTIQTNKIGYAGHTDNPLNPTIDLNFWFLKETYYTYPDLSFTSNNIFNKYHKSYLENITGRDSRTIVANLWLTPIDIYEFTFRKKYFIDGAYYLVNKIVDYNPYVQRSTKVELIKLVNVNVFAGSKIPIITMGVIDRDYGTIKPTKPDFTNINYSDTSIQIGGLNNFISADSERVTLINSSNVQVIGVSDFVGVGLNDIVIDSTYSGKKLVNGDNSVGLKRLSVTVTSAELLDINSVPKLLLAYNGVNKKIVSIDCEALSASPFTAYSLPSAVVIVYTTAIKQLATVSNIMLVTSERVLTAAETNDAQIVYGQDLFLYSANKPTLGTFDIIINLTYYEL